MSNKILQYGDYLFNVCEVEHRGPEYIRNDWRAADILVKPATVVFTCTEFGDEDIARLHKAGPFTIKKVIYNDPATIVMWEDGTKTVVKCDEGDTFDPEKGLLLCIAKKAYGNTGYFNDVLREHKPEPAAIPDIARDVIDALNSLFGIKKNEAEKPEPSFDWEAFKSGKIAVHCPTQEASDDFLRECEKRNLTWIFNDKATKNDWFWETYKKDTVYTHNGRLFYGLVSGFAHVGRKVIEWKVS